MPAPTVVPAAADTPWLHVRFFTTLITHGSAIAPATSAAASMTLPGWCLILASTLENNLTSLPGTRSAVGVPLGALCGPAWIYETLLLDLHRPACRRISFRAGCGFKCQLVRGTTVSFCCSLCIVFMEHVTVDNALNDAHELIHPQLRHRHCGSCATSIRQAACRRQAAMKVALPVGLVAACISIGLLLTALLVPREINQAVEAGLREQTIWKADSPSDVHEHYLRNDRPEDPPL